jgi:hypothetical protein
MIKFFRKIRYDLMEKNKTGKYLKYAVGEIILVVIGILIALSINNWNELRKEKETVKSSLEAMKSNINEDISDLKKQKDYNTELRERVSFALKIIALPQYANQPLTIYADSIGDITQVRHFFPTSIALRSMQSNSHFQYIKDENLKESIYRYYDELDYFSNVTENNVLFSDKRMEEFVFDQMEISSYWPGSNPYKTKSLNSELNNTNVLRNSNVIENVLIGRRLRAGGEIERSENAILASQKLIEKIENYLNEGQ